MGQFHPISKRDQDEMIAAAKRDTQVKESDKVYGKKIQPIPLSKTEVQPFDPILTDTEQAENNRRQNEEGGKALCQGADCEPHTLPVVNPTE